jgi:NTP pyrophosphatase (non-canonical NTP hydrolase)
VADGELMACPRCNEGRAMRENRAEPCRACGYVLPAYRPMPWAIAQTDCWPGTAKVMEECGELVQVLAKLIALGSAGIHWDGSDLRLRIQEEIGDVLGAIGFFMDNNDLDEDAIVTRADTKHETFRHWHDDRMAKHARPSE